MSVQSSGNGWSRRAALKAGAAAGAMVFARDLGPASAQQNRGKTLAIASPAMPFTLDVDNSFSQGTIDTVAAFYDYLVEFERMPDPNVSGAMRENLAPNPSAPGKHNLKGKLAESFVFSDDGRTARFQLRKGVVSAAGNPLTAADVKYTFDRKFAVKGGGQFMLDVMTLTAPDQVKVEGDYTVSFNLDKPNPILMILCAHLSNPIFDSKKCREMATSDDPWARKYIDTNAAGFGPYKLQELTRGQQLIAQAYPGYYDAKPYFQTVIMREVPTSGSRLALLKGGAVDIAQFLSPTEMRSLIGDKNVVVSSFDASRMFWINVNNKFEPLNNRKIRQALNLVMPRQQVLQTIMQGFGSEMTSVMPKGYPGMTDKFAVATDMAAAKKLLEDAGFGNGFTTTLSFNSGNPIEEPIAIMYQTALKEIGVNLQLKKLPAGSFFDNLIHRTEAMITQIDAPWCADPGFSANLYFKSTSYINYPNYVNSEVDALTDTMLSTLDNDVRMKAAVDMQRIVIGDAPWILINYPGFQLAHGKDITGLVYYTSNRLSFQDYGRL